MIAGIRWVRGAVSSALYDEVDEEKRGQRGLTWDDLLTEVLRAWVEQRRRARGARHAASDVEIATPPEGTPVPKSVAGVLRALPNHIEASPREARDSLWSSEEALRELGHPGYQNGILLRASATLVGESGVAAVANIAKVSTPVVP
jgi:hypothetical protein